ncbi:Fe-S cluster assembly protein SufD, partial [Bacillus cereus]|nr:Fe-S cluster assembly protein SufD [Bacillus cereus]
MNVDDLRAWSSAKDEPRWLIERRVHALELAGTLELPKVEKINLEKWDIYESGDYKAENAWSSLEEAPEV